MKFLLRNAWGTPLGICAVLGVSAAGLEAADLTSLQPATIPSGATIEWHTAKNVTGSSTLVPTPANVGPGVYYAVYHFTAENCYSAGNPAVVTANVCGVSTVNLTESVDAASAPAGTEITYHTASPPTDGNRIPNPASVPVGAKYYTAFHDTTTGCYSNANPILTQLNTTCDTDGDGVPDVTDLDDDNDGIPDTVEEATAGGPNKDTDGDGIPDSLDLDSDNDGIPDLVESGGGAADSTGDGRVDGPVGANGLLDSLETTPESGIAKYTPRDSDGDGNPDYQDLDSDNDGINDVTEASPSGVNNDTNGDGKADGPIGANGIPGMPNTTAIVLNPPDTDKDGLPDYRDLDSDNDGVNDVTEAGLPDPDNNGIAGTGSTPADTDNDGIPDAVDGSTGFGDSGGAEPRNSDLDPIPDYRDLDSDNDTIADVIEGGNGPKDTNHDGTISPGESSDGDKDGIPDSVDNDPTHFGDAGNTPPLNTDGSDTPDYIDPDSDNNGTPDITEAGHPGLDGDLDGQVDNPNDPDNDGVPNNGGNDTIPNDFGGTTAPGPDTDGDGFPDTVDKDDDNDGIPDTVEQATALNGGDTDGDGIPDWLDLDSDNDGIPDLAESGQTTGTDANHDGRLDGPVGTDGIPDSVQPSTPGGPNGGTVNYTTKDTDGDGHPDFQDLDSDNDGIPDVVESGGTDTNGDGIADGTPGPTGIPSSTPAGGTVPRDTDGDGVPDQRDLDSDNDGIPDVIESGSPDPDGDGIVGTGTVPTDTDGDGIPDIADGKPGQFGDSGNTAPKDTDGDGVPDTRDLDSDNDGVDDVIESGGSDPDGDGITGTGAVPTDADKDGIPDVADGKPDQFGDSGNPAPKDTDGDGVPDTRDLDSDNDGVPDVIESGGSDPDGNGITGTGAVPPDGDGDGIPDAADGKNGFGDAGNTPPKDTDGDGVPDNQDLDSDNDGIPDVIESGGSDPDGDGISGTGTPVDLDGDGIPDSADGDPNGFGDAGNTPPKDTDGDGVPDYKDLDSDNDGTNDVIENGGTDPDGDGEVGTGNPPDTDKDGIPDIVDGIPDQFGDSGNNPPKDTDGDGVPDNQDLDSDNDTIPDVVEGGNGPRDTNGDGTITPADTNGGDTDGDGIPDVLDGNPNTWGDTNDPGPPDRDHDGTPDSLDPDSDGNGIPDITENGYPGLDPNGDGKIDTPTDGDGDGIPDVADDLPDEFGGTPDPKDTDGDGIPDVSDLDDDNDGIPDTVENASAINNGDSDGDGIRDSLDLDSDNDGIPDVREAGHGGLDSDGDGRIGTPAQGNAPFGANGLADIVETTPESGTTNYTPRDTDGDGRPDYVDLDSDNDSISDLAESGIVTLIDLDNDGTVDGTPNANGIKPGVTNTAAPADTDIDGIPDYRELDSDHDGTNDITDNGFSNLDLNGDGLIDNPADPDQDGIANVLDSKPATFGGFPVAEGCGQWSASNPADTDGDVFPIDQEYALGGSPTLGDHRVSGTTRRQGLTVTKRGNSSAGVDVSFVRPKGRYDVTYTLYGSASIAAVSASWTPMAVKPVITDNNDGTETLTWSNAGALAPLTQDMGFVRLRVETPCHPAGSYTLVQGWSRIQIAGKLQTYGVNFTSPPVFTGIIGGAAGGSISIPASSSGQSLGSYLNEAGAAYYVEITDGAAEGQRFDISSGGADSLNLNLASANSTSAALPGGLAGSHFVIRRHRTLAEVFVNSEWTPNTAIGSADQIQFYNGVGYDVYFNFPGGRWVLPSAGLAVSQNARIIPPGTGVFVSHASSVKVNTQLQIGEVRYNDFVRPLMLGSTGLNLTAQGYPLDASAASLGMTAANGFTPNTATGSASQIQTWKADTTLNETGYYVSSLFNSTLWRQTSPTATTTNTTLFKHDRAAFVLVRQDNKTWKHAEPWDHSLWVQP